MFPSTPVLISFPFMEKGRLRVTHLQTPILLGNTFGLLKRKADQRRKKEKGSHAEKDHGDGAIQEDPKASPGDDERMSNRHFQDGAQDEGQDERRSLEAKLPHEISDHTEDHHNQHIDGIAIDAVRTNETEEENQREENRVGYSSGS